jgi:hypothetical protein
VGGWGGGGGGHQGPVHISSSIICLFCKGSRERKKDDVTEDEDREWLKEDKKNGSKEERWKQDDRKKGKGF